MVRAGPLCDQVPIHHHHVRASGRSLVQRSGPVGSFANHLQVEIQQHEAERRAFFGLSISKIYAFHVNQAAETPLLAAGRKPPFLLPAEKLDLTRQNICANLPM